jgi:hypothetical protein
MLGNERRPGAATGREATAAWVIALVALLAAAPLAALATASSRPAPAENPHGKFRDDCSLCHGANAWKPARISREFDHAKYGFALEGAHAAAACVACHTTLDFTMERPLCATCHEDVHRGEFGTDCERCHTTRSFIDPAGMARMHQTTRFPLAGAHAMLQCERCHAGAAAGRLAFVGIAAECQGCHLEDYRATTNPAHQAGGFPLECASCHTTATWQSARFDHAATGFALTGAHRSVACLSCHGDGVYAGKPTTCVSCHLSEYNGTTNPAHAAGGFSTDCVSCHGTGAWSGAAFDHSASGFPLTGAHAATTCLSCHGDGVFAGKPTTCVSCHLSDYNGTTNPSHSVLAFSTDCASCHATSRWSGATFDHDTSFFPIYSGRHAGLWASCATCHTVSTSFSAFTCFSCHPHDDRAKTDAGHAGRQDYVYDSQACYSCHPQGRH